MTDDKQDMVFDEKINSLKHWLKANKKLINGVLMIVMLGLLGFFLLFKDQLLNSTTTIVYGMGCKEVYINGNLTNGNCSMERALIEQQQKIHQYNLSITNGI